MKNKKKIITGTALVAALAVGGTAAFFTSSDLITNVFKTGSGIDVNPGDDIGIDVNEKFEGLLPGPDGIYGTIDDLLVSFDDNSDGNEYGEIKVTEGESVSLGGGSTDPVTGPGTYPVIKDGVEIGKIVIAEDENGDLVVGPATVLPGNTFTKQMKVDSNVDYNQFLRGEVVITVKDAKGTDVTAEALAKESEEGIKDLVVVYDWAGWSQGTDESGKYYYSSVLGAGASTPDVVESVTLAETAGNWWKDKVVTVTLKAEAIQASDAGWKQWINEATTAGDTIPAMPTTVDND